MGSIASQATFMWVTVLNITVQEKYIIYSATNEFVVMGTMGIYFTVNLLLVRHT